MNIYFSGSIRGGREDQALYAQIIQALAPYGTVLTEHIGLASLSSDGETRSEREIFARDKEWVRQADAVVAEVTATSLGVGMELGYADEWGTPTLCLYRPQESRRLSAMVTGCPNFQVAEYQGIEEVPAILERFFTSIA